jgi:hypothetical protein
MNVSLFSAMRLKILTCVSKWAEFPADVTVGLFNIPLIPPFVAKNVCMNHTHYANIYSYAELDNAYGLACIIMSLDDLYISVGLHVSTTANCTNNYFVVLRKNLQKPLTNFSSFFQSNKGRL